MNEPEQPSTPSTILALSDEFIAQLRAINQLPDDAEAKILIRRLLLKKDSISEKKKITKQATNAYYREDYARLFIPYLLKIEQEKKSFQIDCKKYPGYTVNTIYARLCQSCSYLLENMDEDGKWETIRKTFKMGMKGSKIEFSYVGLQNPTQDFELEEWRDGPRYEDIEAEVTKFIEEGKSNQKLELPRKCIPVLGISAFEDFELTAEEVEKLEALCEPCTAYGMFYKISVDKILLVKVGETDKPV